MEMSLITLFSQRNTILNVPKNNTIIKAIPLELLNLMKGLLMYDVVLPRFPLLIIDDIEFKNRKCSNKIIRSALTNKLHPLLLKRLYTLNDFPKDIQIKIRTKYLSLPINSFQNFKRYLSQ